MSNRKSRVGNETPPARAAVSESASSLRARRKETSLFRLARRTLSSMNATASRLTERAANFEVRLFDPSLVDRLQSPLTHYRE
jgi:hypothetical protein